jgi:hypothetical protein
MAAEPSQPSWAERAREVTAGLAALAGEEQTERQEAAAAALAQADALVGEIEAAPAAELDGATHAALRDLAEASAALRGQLGEDMTQLAGQRSALRQGQRALQGYAATGGSRDGRYLNDRG